MPSLISSRDAEACTGSDGGAARFHSDPPGKRLRSRDEVGSQCSMPNMSTATNYLVDLVKLSCAIFKEEHL